MAPRLRGRRTGWSCRRGTRSRPCRSPASRAAARPDGGSSRPRRGVRRARAAAPGSRRDRPGRRGGRPAARRPARRRASGGAWRGSVEDGRILLAHAAEVVDVEEAPVPAGTRGRSRRPSRRCDSSAHHRFTSPTARWLGTMSRTMPRSAAAELTERLLAAQLVAQSVGVDHVVAVHRARSGVIDGER